MNRRQTDDLPSGRRVVVFHFRASLEGGAGFGSPASISSSLLIIFGFVRADRFGA